MSVKQALCIVLLTDLLDSHLLTSCCHAEIRQAVRMATRLISVLLLTSVAAAPQGVKPTAAGDLGYIYVTQKHVRWPSPESIANDLHSQEPEVRLKALRLLGFPDQEAHVKIWAQTQPTRVLGEAVVTPDQIQLEYAALGEDATQQAILAVEASQTQTMFAAVAVPGPHGWERVAIFDCWCKYEMYIGQNALAESVQVRPAPELGPASPDHFELVLRATGGGTGIRTQHEGHFRWHHGELQCVMSFVSRRLSCPPTPCNIERRWFYATVFGNVMGGFLVEGRGTYASDNQPPDLRFVRDLESRTLQKISCSTYKWDEQHFRYEPFAATNPCEPSSP